MVPSLRLLICKMGTIMAFTLRALWSRSSPCQLQRRVWRMGQVDGGWGYYFSPERDRVCLRPHIKSAPRTQVSLKTSLYHSTAR